MGSKGIKDENSDAETFAGYDDDEEMFPTESQPLSLDSQALEVNMMSFVKQLTDDNVSLPALSQDSMIDIKPSLPSAENLDGKYPSLEAFSLDKVSFSVAPSSMKGAGFLYSKRTKKLFMKTESICSFDVQCELPDDLLHVQYVRAMLVSLASESIHEPIERCHNHAAADSGPAHLKQKVLRCMNEQYEYVGNENGIFFKDRAAVRVRLETEKLGTKIMLQIMCQNTCFKANQRQTALVFTLESEEGNVWARCVVPVKICTNYCRDMRNEEMRTPNLEKFQRRRTNVGRPRKWQGGGKVTIIGQRRIPRSRPTVKHEPYTLVLEMPNRRMGRSVLDYASGIVANAVLGTDDQEWKASLMTYFNNIQTQRDRIGLGNSQDI